MRIEGIEIKNFKAIRAENLELHGRNVYVIGKNGKGKTSFLDAIFKTLYNEDFPPNPLTTGERKGAVKIDMGELIAEIQYNQNNKPSLALYNREGQTFESPRTMLKKVVGIIDFDIKEFLGLSPAKKVDFIKKMVGIDFTDLDDEYKVWYEKRRFSKSKLKDLEAQDVVPINEKMVFIDPLVLQKKITEDQKYNQEVDNVQNRVDRRIKSIATRTQEIEALLLKIEELKKLNIADENSNSEDEVWLFTNNKRDMEKIQNDFEEALKNNKNFEANKKAIEIRGKKKEVEIEIEDADRRIFEIEETKRRVISEAKLPVPGLSFDDNQLYLDGLPFESSQINTARQIVAGLQINLQLLGQVRIARFEGSLLDNDNLEYVEKWAEENDVQLFVEFVDRNEESLKIEIRE